LAYAAVPKPRDIVAAAMAEPAVVPSPKPAPESAASASVKPSAAPAAPASTQAISAPTVPATAEAVPVAAGAGEEIAAAAAADPIDPVAERIIVATMVAERAEPDPAAAPADDPVARLKEMARLKASDNDLVAAPAEAAANETSAASGWVVQIGAVPTQEGEQELLEKAQGSLGEALADVRPVTQQIEHQGETLYRARFAGFSGKDEAREACQKLKSKSFAAWRCRGEDQRCFPRIRSLASLICAASAAEPPRSGWTCFISRRCASRTSASEAPGSRPRIS
jgi:D-alanyl-D-alanine carboxypeptidase